MTTDNETLFIFGGKDEGSRMNDLWSFSLSDYRFTKLKDEGELPAVRNGHSMNYSEGKLYVFGGIHDITWELDDLHIYTLKVRHWSLRTAYGPRWNRTRPGRSIGKWRTQNTPAKKDPKRPGKRNWPPRVPTCLENSPTRTHPPPPYTPPPATSPPPSTTTAPGTVRARC
jgi:hypothetical protein